MTNYIFVTGGVCSSLGKGVIVSSISVLLQSFGYTVALRKLDPYININPGMIGPDQHGEVYVTADGAETDLDLGHYERFSGVESSRSSNVTSGIIYQSVINKERSGKYLGSTVQVIPHITNEIKSFILDQDINVDFQLIEIGGTVGDIESLPFLEAIRQISRSMPENTLFVHCTLIPFLPSAQEAKTKPTQYSVKELRSLGIEPNILVCRSVDLISQECLNKISLVCGIKEGNVISCPDVNNIYKVPLILKNQELDWKILNHFSVDDINLVANDTSLFCRWSELVERMDQPEHYIKIGLVGKYKIQDAYKSICESIKHSSAHLDVNTTIEFICSENLNNLESKVLSCDAIIIPGGFGARATLGKIEAIRICREKNIPILGICYGCQLMAIEYARNVMKFSDANSTEIDNDTSFPLVRRIDNIKNDKNEDTSSTIYLGNKEISVEDNSFAKEIYGENVITERHRHRYCIDKGLFSSLDGLICSGKSDDLVEIIEIKNHRWFVGVQFHPEFKSKFFLPHPLFNSLIKEAVSSNLDINKR